MIASLTIILYGNTNFLIVLDTLIVLFTYSYIHLLNILYTVGIKISPL